MIQMKTRWKVDLRRKSSVCVFKAPLISYGRAYQWLHTVSPVDLQLI